VELANGAVVVDDCYNANPMSMRAALDELSRAPGRKVAVLGDMLELGPDERRFHEELGAYARERADVLVTVGPLAAAMGGDHAVADAAQAAALVEDLVRPGDTVLVKASRGVGLEAVTAALV
jgi:UDP-N-acetylmuramoyl-tripeptide--D-alanyl-D-alanine ligase